MLQTGMSRSSSTSLNLSPTDLVQAHQAALRYMKNSIRPNERVAISPSSGNTTRDFTADRDLLQQALNAIQPRANIIANTADCPPMSIYQALICRPQQ